MDVDPWVEWVDMPPTFEIEGTPCVVSPYFLGYKLKTVATRCQIFRLKFTKFDFGWGSAQTHSGSLQRFSRPPPK